MPTFTVKAFKPKPPFDLIVEDFAEFEPAHQLWGELCRDPEIDAAYLYEDGRMAYNYHEAYDYYLNPDLEPEPYSYFRQYRTPDLNNLGPQDYQIYVWKSKDGVDFSGDFVPAFDGKGHLIVGNELDEFRIRGVDSHGQQVSFIELTFSARSDNLPLELFETVRRMLQETYDATRLVQAAKAAIGKDDDFARYTLEVAQNWLMGVLDRRSIEADQ